MGYYLKDAPQPLTQGVCADCILKLSATAGLRFCLWFGLEGDEQLGITINFQKKVVLVSYGVAFRSYHFGDLDVPECDHSFLQHPSA